MTQVGMAKTFRGDLAALPAAVRGKAAIWLADYLLHPDDARFEAHRVARSLMPNLWTAKLDDAYRVIYRQGADGVRHLLLCDRHDEAYRRAEKLRAVHAGGVVEVMEGRTTRAVKVGTLFRAKGLEFKDVYLPHASASLLDLNQGDDSDEARELARRRFFVGMTRARDRLFITWSGEPSEFLEPLLQAPDRHPEERPIP